MRRVGGYGGSHQEEEEEEDARLEGRMKSSFYNGEVEREE